MLNPRLKPSPGEDTVTDLTEAVTVMALMDLTTPSPTTPAATDLTGKGVYLT